MYDADPPISKILEIRSYMEYCVRPRNFSRLAIHIEAVKRNLYNGHIDFGDGKLYFFDVDDIYQARHFTKLDILPPKALTYLVVSNA